MYVRFIKRGLDLIIALVCLPAVLLTILIVSLFILLDDGWPVFYNAERIGKNGKLFKMYKFRSMKNNAPDIRTETGDTYNSEDDPRVTRVGRFLRKTSIDEIPQLLNILKGDMSLIGPRPDPPDWLDKYTAKERIFLKVKPGITGYNQAFFRNSATAKEKIRNDIYYTKKCSFLLDLRILVQTVSTVLKHENVYRE